ncbi:hypothetical protein EK904_013566, partial [Melospiza melodia maxima]
MHKPFHRCLNVHLLPFEQHLQGTRSLMAFLEPGNPQLWGCFSGISLNAATALLRNSAEKEKVQNWNDISFSSTFTIRFGFQNFRKPPGIGPGSPRGTVRDVPPSAPCGWLKQFCTESVFKKQKQNPTPQQKYKRKKEMSPKERPKDTAAPLSLCPQLPQGPALGWHGESGKFGKDRTGEQVPRSSGLPHAHRISSWSCAIPARARARARPGRR